jgi:hypothetical protein
VLWRLLDVKGIIADTGEDICIDLPTLHAFSGCDSTNAFVHKGKVAAIWLLQRNSEFVDTFMLFETTEETPGHILDKLEQFTCLQY